MHEINQQDSLQYSDENLLICCQTQNGYDNGKMEPSIRSLNGLGYY